MLNSIFLFGLGATEIILIIVAILLLFGGKKIPELMRGMGRGIKEFKDSQNGDSTTTTKEEERKV